jgi:hypothetical protein
MTFIREMSFSILQSVEQYIVGSTVSQNDILIQLLKLVSYFTLFFKYIRRAEFSNC